jgi:hypothetical protein
LNANWYESAGERDRQVVDTRFTRKSTAVHTDAMLDRLMQNHHRFTLVAAGANMHEFGRSQNADGLAGVLEAISGKWVRGLTGVSDLDLVF